MSETKKVPAVSLTEVECKALALSVLNAVIAISQLETAHGIRRSDKRETIDRVVTILRATDDWPTFTQADEETGAGLIHSLEAVIAAARSHADYTMQNHDEAVGLRRDCDFLEKLFGR